MQRTIERCVHSHCILQKWTCDLRFCETWNFVQFILRSYWRGFLLVNKCTASQSTPWNKHCQVSTTAREEGSSCKLAIFSSNLAIQNWRIRDPWFRKRANANKSLGKNPKLTDRGSVAWKTDASAISCSEVAWNAKVRNRRNRCNLPVGYQLFIFIKIIYNLFLKINCIWFL